MEPGWIVLRVKTQRAAAVAQKARALLFDVWLPLYERVVARRGKVRRGTYPLFPGYLFIRLDPRWKAMLAVRDVIGALVHQERPLLARDDEVQAIARQCDERGVYRASIHVARFAFGQIVTPSTGALAGLTGRFEGAVRGKEVALFELFGTQRRAAFREGILVGV